MRLYPHTPHRFSYWQQPPTLTKGLLFHLYRNGRPRDFPGRQIDELATKLALRAFGPKAGMLKMETLRNAASARDDLIVSLEGFDQRQRRGGNRREIEQLLLLPWVPKPKTSVDLFLPDCAYLHSHYHFVIAPSLSTFGYGVFRPNDVSPLAP